LHQIKTTSTSGATSTTLRTATTVPSRVLCGTRFASCRFGGLLIAKLVGHVNIFNFKGFVARVLDQCAGIPYYLVTFGNSVLDFYKLVVAQPQD
jgi:hypothetical protein